MLLINEKNKQTNKLKKLHIKSLSHQLLSQEFSSTVQLSLPLSYISMISKTITSQPEDPVMFLTPAPLKHITRCRHEEEKSKELLDHLSRYSVLFFRTKASFLLWKKRLLGILFFVF